MKIDIFGKNIKLDEPLRVFVEDRIGGLDKFIEGEVEAKVEIGLPSTHHRSGDVYYAEVNLKIGGKLLRAEASNADLRNAITEVKDELQIQIKKFKEKITDAARAER